MDSLPPEMLSLICSRLPWKDRLAVRAVSRKFCNLRPDPVPIFTCRIEQKDKKFIIGLAIDSKKEEKVIEISKDPLETSYTIKKAEVYTGRKGLTCHKTSVICSQKEFPKFIEIYMKYLLSPNFKIDYLRLVNLNNENLRLLRETQGKLRRRDVESRRLELYSTNIKMSKEERKLMELYKDQKKFKYSPPYKFRAPRDFWHIPLIRNASELTLHYGRKMCRLSLDSPSVECNLGITDGSILCLVAGKKKWFSSNALSRVTPQGIMEYIENSLRGGHTLSLLHLHHDFSAEDVYLIRTFLRRSCFQEHSQIRWIDGRTNKNESGDVLKVDLTPNVIRIYLGKKTIIDNSSPQQQPVELGRFWLIYAYPSAALMFIVCFAISVLLMVAHHKLASREPEDHELLLIRLVESMY